MIEWLADLAIEGHRPTRTGGSSHPMRAVTRRAAGLDGGRWGPTDRREVARVFGELAGEWHTRTSPERAAVVADALDRGLPDGRPDGLALEVGSGIGAYSAQVAERWGHAVAVELSYEMSRRAPAAPADRVLADGSCLPFVDGSAAAVVLVNMFLFPAEVDRVLAPDGVVVWASSSGEETPIHLMPEEVDSALPGDWNGVAARAGCGLWAVLRRAGK